MQTTRTLTVADPKDQEHLVSLAEFSARFPSDDACLEFLWRTRFSPDGESALCPECGEVRKFRRYDSKARRRAWSCTACGHYIHPTSGTIFHKSSTPLHLWFLTVYILVATHHVVTIKHLERVLGVTYKTAWRMAHLISQQLSDSDVLDQPVGLFEEDPRVNAFAAPVLREETRPTSSAAW